MPMPYKIELCPLGPTPEGGQPQMRAYKFYPHGSSIASAEDLQIWEYVQSLEAKIEDLQGQIESGKKKGK